MASWSKGGCCSTAFTLVLQGSNGILIQRGMLFHCLHACSLSANLRNCSYHIVAHSVAVFAYAGNDQDLKECAIIWRPRVLLLHRMHPVFLAVRGLVTASIYLQRPAGVMHLIKYRLSSTSSTAADNTDQLHTILKHTDWTLTSRTSLTGWR